jgi:hypothetical protein
LTTMLATVILAPPASASVGGTFVAVARPGVCTLATGFSTQGTATCGSGIGGNDYIFLPDAGGSLTYSFTVPGGTSEALTYGIPAGGFVNNVDATVSLDGGAPVTLSSHLGAFDQTAASDLALWTGPSVGPGPHTWTITTTGDAVNIYGLWVTGFSTSLSDGGQSGTTVAVAPGTAVTDSSTLTGTNASSATGTVTYDVYSDSLCTTAVSSGPAETITTPGTLPDSGAVTLNTPGTYYWRASYSGDSNNVATTAPCGLEVETVLTPTTCTPGTTGCAATVTTPLQIVAVTGTKLSSSTASITVAVATQVLSCANFSYAGQVTTLTDSGLVGTSVSVVDTVRGLPSKKGIVICYQPVEASPPPPVFLAKCHGAHFVPPCFKSVKEVAGSVVATLELPPGDPRFHVGGETPQITSIKPTSAAPGKKLSIKGVNLSEVTGVTIGGVVAHIIKAAPTKVSVIVPAGAQSGTIRVSSLAGVSTAAAQLTVSAAVLPHGASKPKRHERAPQALSMAGSPGASSH